MAENEEDFSFMHALLLVEGHIPDYCIPFSSMVRVNSWIFLAMLRFQLCLF